MVRAILARWVDNRTKRAASRDFVSEMKSALADGVLSEDKRFWLLERHSQLGAGDEWRGVADELFMSAVRGTISNEEITPEAESELGKIREYLELDAERAKKALQLLSEKRQNYESRINREGEGARRRQAIKNLEDGLTPPILMVNVVMKKGEFAIWKVQSTLYETRVVRREITVGSRGVSVRLMKGVTVRVGASRGQSVPVVDSVPVSVGNLIITNQRLVFQGDAKSFADGLGKVIDVHPYSDGLKFSVVSRQQPRFLKFSPDEGEFCCAALNRAMREFSE